MKVKTKVIYISMAPRWVDAGLMGMEQIGKT